MERFSTNGQKNRACNLFIKKIAKGIGFVGCDITPLDCFEENGIATIGFEIFDRISMKFETVKTRWEVPKDKRKTPVFLRLC